MSLTCPAKMEKMLPVKKVERMTSTGPGERDGIMSVVVTVSASARANCRHPPSCPSVSLLSTPAKVMAGAMEVKTLCGV